MAISGVYVYIYVGSMFCLGGRFSCIPNSLVLFFPFSSFLSPIHITLSFSFSHRIKAIFGRER